MISSCLVEDSYEDIKIPLRDLELFLILCSGRPDKIRASGSLILGRPDQRISRISPQDFLESKKNFKK